MATGLHRKSTAGNALLRADSANPGHTIKGVPYGQFLRLKLLCSTPVNFEKKAMEMTQRFIDRGYRNKIVNRALLAVKSIPRDTLLMGNTSNCNASKNKKKYSMSFSNNPVFSTLYSSEFSKIKNTVNKDLRFC